MKVFKLEEQYEKWENFEAFLSRYVAYKRRENW